MFNIKVDNKLVDYLASKNIKIEELFVVTCMVTGNMDLLKAYLSGRNGDQCTAYFQTLERKRLVFKVVPELVDFDWDNYEAGEQAEVLLDDCICNVMMEPMEKKNRLSEVRLETPGGMVNEPTNKADMSAFIDAFIELFPEGSRNRAGEYLRTNKTDIVDKMSKFMRKYRMYDEGTILGATKNYLSKQSRDGYAYCNAAHYYVSKNGVSKLATECESWLREGSSGTDLSWQDNLM